MATDIRGHALFMEYQNGDEVAQHLLAPELLSPVSGEIVPPTLYTRTLAVSGSKAVPDNWRMKRKSSFVSQAHHDGKTLIRDKALNAAIEEAERGMQVPSNILEAMGNSPTLWRPVGTPFAVEIGPDDVVKMEAGSISIDLGRRIAACRDAFGAGPNAYPTLRGGN